MIKTIKLDLECRFKWMVLRPEYSKGTKSRVNYASKERKGKEEVDTLLKASSGSL